MDNQNDTATARANGRLLAGFGPHKPASDPGRAWRRGAAAGAFWLALACAPLASAADLLISNLSDGIHDPSPVGGQVTYHVVVENGDIDTATGVVAIFDLPTGASAAGLPAFCAAAATSPVRVLCDIGTLDATPRSFDLVVGTTGMTPGDVFVHGAIGFAPGLPGAGEPVSGLAPAHPFFAGDIAPSNNLLSERTTLQNSGDLRLAKSGTPDPVVGGAEVTYTLAVTNDGPNASGGFTVVDTLPAGVTFVPGSFSGAGWTFDAGATSATYPGTLAAGASASFTIRARVGVGSGNIVNAAVVNAGAIPDPNPANNNAEAITAVTPGADLTVSKRAEPSPAVAGDPGTFQVQVRNLGPSDSANVRWTDVLPAGFLVTGGTAPPGWNCTTSPDATTHGCVYPGSLGVGATADFTIEATVPSNGANSAGNVTNRVTVAADTPDPNGPLLGSDNNTFDNVFTVLPDGADLSLSKQKLPALVAVWPGVGPDDDSRMTSTIRVRNNGPRAATGGVQVVDVLAVGEEFVSGGNADWSCSVSPASWSAPVAQVVTCDLDASRYPLALGASAPVLQLVTRARRSGSLDNQACTGGSGGSIEPTTGSVDEDRNADNDCAGGGTRTTDDRVDLQLEKWTNTTSSADNTLVVGTDSLTYTLRVTNLAIADAVPATGIVVNDTLPGYVPPVGASAGTGIAILAPPGWNCGDSAGANVICRSGTTALAPGNSAEIVVTVSRPLFDSLGQTLPAGSCGTANPTSGAFCNVAGVGVDPAVAGSIGEINGANNSARDWVSVEREANVRTTTKDIVTGDIGRAGVDSNYVMSYLNEGPSAVPGVVFQDVFTIPAGDAGFVLRSATRTPGSVACPASPAPGLVATTTAGGVSYANPTGGALTLAITCPAIDLVHRQSESVLVSIRPNVDAGNNPGGRRFDNNASFTIAGGANGVDADGAFNFNTDTADDDQDASLTFESGVADLIVNKVDTGFTGGVDPLGFDATNPSANLITYRVSVRNDGPSVATGVHVVDSYRAPAGRQVEFVGIATGPSGGPSTAFDPAACSIVSGTNPFTGAGSALADPAGLSVRCDVPGAGFAGSNVPGTLGVGSTAYVFIQYRYLTPPGASGDIARNFVVAEALETDPTPGNNSAEQPTTIRTRADMAVDKSVFTDLPASDPDAALPPVPATSVTLLQPFYYVLDGTNNGPGASLSRDRSGTGPLNGTGTVITDTLPAGLEITGAITWQKTGPDPGGDEEPVGSGTCPAPTGSLVTCQLGDVTVTGKVRIIIPARWATWPAGGSATNTARVSTEQVDPVVPNNTDSVVIAVTRSSLAGVVYEDRDRSPGNGGRRQPAQEPGIAGVTVTLEGTDAYGNAVSLTTTTDGNGAYGFTGLAPAGAGGYTLTQGQPAGYLDSPYAPPVAPDPDAPSLGGTYATGTTYTGIAVGGDAVGVRYDFPEVRQPSLSGYVYIDANYNDIRDAGDGAIAGATVELLDAATGSVVATTTTDAAGAYVFNGLDPLVAYTLRQPLPAGSYSNRPSAVNPGLVGAAACASGCVPGTGLAGDPATTDRISGIDLGAGLDGTAFNFGEYMVAAISGSVYVDRNGNGQFDAGDAGTLYSAPNGGLAGVTVTLLGAGPDGVFGNGDDPAPVVVQTDANGVYRFPDVVVGQNYRVEQAQPDGFGSGLENPSNVVAINALPASGSSENDFGEVLGSLAGSVFEDFSATAANNNNGSFDPGENPIATVTLALTGSDLAGNPVSRTVQTGTDGGYAFADLMPPAAGTTYTITQTQPAGYLDGRHTPGNASTPGSASAPNVIDGIAITAGEGATGYLFGELANATISGTVYLDRDDDGAQGPGEPGLPGVTVTIEGAGPDGIFGTADDPAPVVLVTDATGNYSYGGAVTGRDYRIVQTQPTGLADGRENPSNSIAVSNLPITGASGNNFGEQAASIAGSVWLDANNDGVRDAGEAGIAGVVVSLPAGTLDALGNPVSAALSDANGDYRFIDLLAGTYAVTQQVAQPVVGGVTTLNGTTLAGTIGGAPGGSASAVATLPSSVSGIVLPAGGDSIDNDFGETLPVSLSGRVFFDADNDGAQSGPAETGIANVVLELSGVDDTGAAVSLGTSTDANGDFRFDGLRPGTYTVTQPTQPPGTSNGQTIAGSAGGSATPITTVPSAISGIDLATPGADSTGNLFGEIPLNSAISGRVWSDLDNNGVIDPAESGIEGVLVRLSGTDLAGNAIERDLITGADGSYAFTELPPGNYTLTQPDQPPGTLNGITVPGTGGGTATGPQTTPSVVAGITLGVGQEAGANNFGEIPVGSVAGRVFNDSNNNGLVDPGEAGIAGVQVVLTGNNDLGEAIDVSVVTDAEGRYRFDDLRPGTYALTQPVQPPETLNGITSAGTIDGTVVGSATPVEVTPSAITAIVLPTGGQSIDNNFGEIGDSPDLVVSKRASPAQFTVNNAASYTVTVRNRGQQPTDGEYSVHDRLPAGISLAGIPAGDGWTCSGQAGDTRFSCRSSRVIAAGATASAPIEVPVAVAVAAAGEVVNAVLVEGGGENPFRAPTPAERAAFEGNVGDLPPCDPAITQNACRVTTRVQLSAALSGTVWLELGNEETHWLDAGDQRLSGWTVELVDPASGQAVRTATTGSDGRYRFDDVIPGVRWNLRFRDPDSGVVWGWPVSAETPAGPPAPCDADAAIAAGTASSCRTQAGGATALEVVLRPGAELAEQSLPLDPGGVVYDAITRAPVPGSVVTLAPVGMCAGYDPAVHLLNAGQGGYRIEGGAVSMTVGGNGHYQFVFADTAPARCEFSLAVAPPSGYSFVSTVIPAQAGTLSPPGSGDGRYPVLPDSAAPTAPVGDGTRYYLAVAGGSDVARIVRNHLPLDPLQAPGLNISKTGNRQIVEIGDTIEYTITVRQTAGAALAQVTILDRLPRGFTYVAGTARVDGRGIDDPAGQPGPRLAFEIGAVGTGAQRVLSYRARVGVGSDQGDGVNHAQGHGCAFDGTCVDAGLQPYPGSVPSNRAQYRVRVTGGVFSSEGCVLGKVFVDCNRNHVQDTEELGIPGVRMYFEDGTWMVSDSEGKYSYCGLPPRSHTLKVDASTLPPGARLTTSSNRNLGDADSLFIDLKNGELHRADFVEGSCSNPVIEQVKARRTQGEVRAPETETGQPALRFESKPVRSPQQGTDPANQGPIVDPRPVTPAAADQEVQP